MSRKVKLHLPLDNFIRLGVAANSEDKLVRISRWDLRALIRDHANCLIALGDQVEDDYANSDQVRTASS